jgi:ABC-type nitrate/sulfonate/bicarbonate transport system ATPase subunit
MAREVLITCRRLGKSYYDIREGQRVVALDDVSLEIGRGAFVTVIGPSGCGKTTLLNIVAGFERPSSGEVRVEDRLIEGPGADRGVVFQEYALFPWLTLRQNVEYGPRERGVPRAEAREIVDRTLRLVSLEGADNRYPHELSGGMRQRVALARVLVNDPKILLMDEPFAAVDAQTRAALQREVARLWAETGKTVLFVTHSVEEAVLLGDRVIALAPRPGRVKDEVAVSPAFNDYRRAIENLLADAYAAASTEDSGGA